MKTVVPVHCRPGRMQTGLADCICGRGDASVNADKLDNAPQSSAAE